VVVKATVKEDAQKQGRDLSVLLLIVPLRALFLMLGLGVLHNDWTPSVPALGFWASMVVSLMITGVLRR
jgi:hypothetical protein